MCVFFPGDLANTSVGAGYVGFGTLTAGSMVRLRCCDAGRVMLKSCVPWGSCRVLCRDDCRDAVPLRLVEALPLSERLGHTPVEAMPFFKRFGHTVLAMLENLAATFCCKVSEVVLLAWGGCENIRLLAMSELALRAWSMQNSPEKGEAPRVICLNEMVPDGSSRPGHGLPPLSPPPGIPRLPGGLNWAPRCSPEEWTAWCRVRDGLDVSNDFFEVVQIEQEEEEEGFDLAGIAEVEGWDQTELMYFVFEFGTKKGMQYCREYYEMKNSARQQEDEEEVFDLVGVAEAEGWDQTELMFFVFEYGAEKGVQLCREYYEMKNSRQEVRQAVYPEPTKEAKVRFLFRESGRLGVQVVDGGLTLEEWFAGREGENLGVGVDGYFTTLGGRMFNPKVEISRLGLDGLQEVVFHGRLKGGACKGAGRVDSPNAGEWQCSFCMAPHCWHSKMACYRCGTPRYWESGALGQGVPEGWLVKVVAW